jgi:hypothetical protein
MKASILPIDFAELLVAAQQHRAVGNSQVMSAIHACRDRLISDVWAPVIIGFLNDSPSAAEAWAERRRNDVLDTFSSRLEGTQE